MPLEAPPLAGGEDVTDIYNYSVPTNHKNGGDNVLTLKESLELAGRNLLNCLCPTRDYLPHWCLEVERDYRAQLFFYWPAHNIGRWWDAMLRLENAIGFPIPAHLEAAMLKNLQWFFNNPDNLCFAPLDCKYVEPLLELHSLRESLLALNALVRYRNSRWAQEQAHQMLKTIRRIIRHDGSWNLDKIDYFHRNDKRPEHLWQSMHTPGTFTHGRLIEALVWYYEATGDSLALELADIFARHHWEHTTTADGNLNVLSKADHTHSYLGTLRGLLLFGLLTNQSQYVERVAMTYRASVRRMVKESGFTPHDLGKDKKGETTSPGDAAQIALWLGHCGYPQLLDDVERIVRTRLLPSQITESPGLRPFTNDDKDEHSNLDERIVGGFGGMHTEPHAGKKNVTDITAADVHTLVDVYRHVAIHSRAGLVVNFHFDYEDENVKITSQRGKDAQVTITPKLRENMLIRIPQWAPKESVRVKTGGKTLSPIMLNGFAYLPKDRPSLEIVVQYALPTRTLRETTDGTEYTLLWRGDEITGVYPNSDFFPFYPTGQSHS